MSSSSNSPAAPAQTDARLTLLKTWLSSLQLVDADSVRPASSDASFRRYFRLDALPGAAGLPGATVIAMDAPPERENVPAFIKVAGLFKDAGVSVPEIIAQDLDNGFLLLSDLGTTTYLDALDHDNASVLYAEALESLIRIQQASAPDVLPEFDRTVILRELNLFPEWYIGKHLGATLTDVQATQLNQVFETLAANILSQQQVFMHRDFHSRNLMHVNDGSLPNPGILDFQDAAYGPITYDIASLLRDAYIQWDEELVLDWVIRYWQRAKQLGLPVNPDIDAFYRDFEFTALQRHLKILGIFARLNYRDGKDQYMGDLPTVLDYVRKTAGRYKELKPLTRLLDALENKAPQVGYTF